MKTAQIWSQAIWVLTSCEVEKRGGKKVFHNMFRNKRKNLGWTIKTDFLNNSVVHITAEGKKWGHQKKTIDN